MDKKTLVIARHEEDVKWSAHWPNWGWTVEVVEKSTIGNWGREAGSYLHYIVENYDRLRGLYLFCQGDPWPHVGTDDDSEGHIRFSPTVASPSWFCPFVEDNLLGRPHHWEDLPMAQLWGRIFEEPPPEFLTFSPGANFSVFASKIKTYPLTFWKMLLDYCRTEPKAPWVMERLWYYLI